MAKKQKTINKSQKSNNLAKALLVILGLVLVFMICAQLVFNFVVWKYIKELQTVNFANLSKSALKELEDIMIRPEKGTDNRRYIPEAKLVLPAESPELDRVIYLHHPKGDGEFATPESLQMNTKSIYSRAISSLYASNINELLYDVMPGVQACSRGFMLQFEPLESTETVKLSGTVKLQDGRTLYVYRETNCNYEELNQFESYLLKAQSY